MEFDIIFGRSLTDFFFKGKLVTLKRAKFEPECDMQVQIKLVIIKLVIIKLVIIKLVIISEYFYLLVVDPRKGSC